MCGIAAIFSSEIFPLSDMEKMMNLIRHRGPDDEGMVGFNDAGNMYICGGKDTPDHVFFTEKMYLPNEKQYLPTENVNIALGHRRLSIIDLSALGHQPMCDTNGRFWIVFNGEIYNYLELREELKNQGIIFQSETDTEVILESYKMWGKTCQDRFNGMWAFVIYDTQEKTIFLSRDRYGIKPLYYWVSENNQILLGSEIKQFTFHDSWKPVLHKKAAFDYLFYGLTDHQETTMFQGVYKILPGYYFIGKVEDLDFSKEKKLQQHKWFQYSSDTFKGSFSEAKEIFKKHFDSAIKLHMRADVEVGTALSGGLDSSSIVCQVNNLLKAEGKEKLQKTFSSCSEDERFDEKIWMDEVISFTKVDAHFVFPEGKDVFNLTDKIIWHMDEPYQSQSVFLGYHVFETAKKNNVIVLLNGQGADEYLSGYTDFRNLRLMNLLQRGKWFSFYREMKNFPLGITIKFIMANMVTMTGLRKFIHLIPGKNHQEFFNKIVHKEKLGSDFSHPYAASSYKKNSTKEISEHQLSTEPLQKYLRWEDRNSMAHSIEARVPFLDYRLVEFCRRLPLNYLDGPGESKKILIHALSGILPERIVNRKDKKGFITPEEKWFTEDFPDEFDKLFLENVGFAQGIINKEATIEYFKKIREKKIPFDYSYWRITLFCIWMKVFKVQLN